ncbi:hypothetical protein L3X38_036574 [Prunus dulcis]|uniref:Uncharacterized protein n=1 Tax=Prunus dulcis TaxID=3755 RepID=A0AAD4YNQ4_PRUDU|nr:hypothetical protein L3X38_036574 [Prunus dulcis]
MHSMPLAHGTIWVIQTYGAKTYLHYGMPLLDSFPSLHSSPDRNEDYVSSPTLTHCHQVLEAIESLRRQTGLSEYGVHYPPPPPLILDIMGPALSDLLDLMPIIQLAEGLHKKKGRCTPKKGEVGSRSVPVKNSVKRKTPEDVAIGSDVIVRGMDSNCSKRFCSGACSDKAKETGIVVSPGGPP